MAHRDCKPLPPLSEYDIARFWRHVDQSGGLDACWPWTGSKAEGYGIMSVGPRKRARRIGTHRISYFLFNGVDPAPLLTCHSCDNRPCCNPRHLFSGSYKDNSDDRDRKGRGATGERSGARKHPEKVQRGESRWNHKFAEQDVAEIRRLILHGESISHVVARFKSSRGAIDGIISGRNWKHLLTGDEKAKIVPVARWGKLTSDQVKEIRKLHSTGTPQRHLAKLFSITQPTISEIVNGKIWKHLLPPVDSSQHP